LNNFTAVRHVASGSEQLRDTGLLAVPDFMIAAAGPLKVTSLRAKNLF
jgi:hypothetical protein